MTPYEYESDGAWSQAAAVGQALYVEDNLGHRTHFRYDGRGNRTLVTDALGSTWETAYNLADQVVSTQQPATGQQGSGRVTVLYEYVFPGGPRTEVTVLDEAGAVVQHINHQLGAEGELLAVSGGTTIEYRLGNVQIDLTTRRILRDGRLVKLTRHEFALLEALLRHAGRVITHRSLLREVWGPHCQQETHYLRVHIANLRKKLEPEPARPQWILTEQGVGYRLVLPA